MAELTRLSAIEAAAAIAAGEIHSEDLVRACIDRIDQRDGQVRAWQYLDREGAIRRAKELDGRDPVGPLHGIPIGIKDVITTRCMPTGYGSPIYEGYYSEEDATCIALLKRAGAIILGKTVTAEFATYQPGPTTNPHAAAHTPGGSSSGSAAAVADYHVPLALGTQTAGSVIRPASYCGVIGYKPSKPRYDDVGVIETARHLDTLGTFSRSVEDAALVDSILASHSVEPSSVPSSPVIGICRTHVWSQASSDMQRVLEDTAERLAISGVAVVAVTLPDAFAGLSEAQQQIHAREAYENLNNICGDNSTQVSSALVSFLAAGKAVSPDQYHAARKLQQDCREGLAAAFGAVDCLLTPGATGIAPYGIGDTGDPAFSRIWTALGVPCLGFPAATKRGLPLGLQMIGLPDSDRALLALGAWMVRQDACTLKA